LAGEELAAEGEWETKGDTAILVIPKEKET